MGWGNGTRDRGNRMFGLDGQRVRNMCRTVKWSVNGIYEGRVVYVEHLFNT